MYGIQVIKMGANCTHIEVSPEAAAAIRSDIACRSTIRVRDPDFETIWRCLGPYIHVAIERKKVRHLLHDYLGTYPCRDRFLVLHFQGRRWMFEILSNRYTAEVTELVLSQTVK